MSGSLLAHRLRASLTCLDRTPLVCHNSGDTQAQGEVLPSGLKKWRNALHPSPGRIGIRAHAWPRKVTKHYRQTKVTTMVESGDKLKLGKSSAFTKGKIRSLPLTDAEFEADFFLDPVFSTKRQPHWQGMVIERESGGLLAMEPVRIPPPTVNGLATLLAHAMLRPLDAQDRQRPAKIYLRDRPQWQELLPHLRQLEIAVELTDDLPWFDEAVMDWVKEATKPPSRNEIQTALRNPFPTQKRS